MLEQAPQSFGSEDVSTHTGQPPHCWIAELVVSQTHFPPEHDPAPHATPHAPQSASSVPRSTQV